MICLQCKEPLQEGDRTIPVLIWMETDSRLFGTTLGHVHTRHFQSDAMVEDT
jgi:hypothetical protein